MDKLLVVSRKFPPSIGGSQLVMRNLFTFFSPEEYMVCHDDERINVNQGNEFTYHELRIDFPHFIRKILGSLLIPLYIFLIPIIVYKLLRLHKKEKIGKCLINYPDPFFSVAGYIFSRVANIEYFLYFHDLFSEAQKKYTRVVQKLLAEVFERQMIRKTQNFMVISEGLRDFYEEKYNIRPTVLPHSIDLSILNQNPLVEKKMHSLPKITRIVYSGGVYDDQYDAILAFVKAIKNSDLNIKFVISSKSPRKYFEKIGIADENTEVVFFENDEDVFRLQKQADILYLPLAFESPAPLEVKMAIPTKIFEYIASMRPILVHCPADSFLSEFCRKNKIGYVFNTKEEKDILLCIEKLTNRDEYHIDYRHRVNFLKKYDRKKIYRKFRKIIGFHC